MFFYIRDAIIFVYIFQPFLAHASKLAFDIYIHWLIFTRFQLPNRHDVIFSIFQIDSFLIFLINLVTVRLGLGLLHSHLTPLPSSDNDVMSFQWLEMSTA